MKSAGLLASFLLLLSFKAGAGDYYNDGLSAPEGLTYAIPSEVGFNENGLNELLGLGESTQSDVLLLIKDNKIILEKYWRGDDGTPIQVFSITKSITSLAIGILIDEDRLSVQDPLKKFFPAWSVEKGEIILQQLLTHTSGLKPTADEDLEKQKDVLQYCLDLPLGKKPGQHFNYSSAGVMLLGEVIARVTHSSEEEFVQKKIFSPLKITHARWRKDAVGHVKSYLGLSLTPRELLRIGQLMMARGKWQGEPIVSASYIEQALAPSAHQANYGYLWWRIKNAFYAKGNHGQFLAVYPAEKMILIRLKQSSSVGKDLKDIELWTPMIRRLPDLMKRTPHG